MLLHQYGELNTANPALLVSVEISKIAGTMCLHLT